MSYSTEVVFQKVHGGFLRVEVGLIIQYRDTGRGTTNIWVNYIREPIEVAHKVDYVAREIQIAKNTP